MVFHHHETCLEFFVLRFSSSFWILFIVYWLTIKSFLKLLLTLFQILLFFRRIDHLLSKRHISSFIKTFWITTHFWEHYTKLLNFFIILVTKKIFKTFFTKRNLVRYYHFLDIHIIYLYTGFL